MLSKRIYPASFSNVNTQLAEIASQLEQPRNFPTLPYKIYKSVYGQYVTEDIITNKETRVQLTYYVNKATGSDSNSGLTDVLALKTLKTALQKVQNNNTYQHYRIIVIGSSTFYQDELAGEVAFTNKTCLIRPNVSTDRIVVHGGIQSLTWALTSGKTNTYETVSASTICGVVDCRSSNVDYYGLYIALTPVTSIDLVESTAGSYYLSADKLTAYVHLSDNSVPTADVWAMRDNYCFRFNHNNGNAISGIILKNVDVIGANIFTATRSSATGVGTYEWICVDCTFQHGIKGNLVAVNNYTTAIMVNCLAGYAVSDVFNYAGSYLTNAERNASIVVEVNCVYRSAGVYGATTGINNLSTSHNGMNVLRCGCSGMNSKGPLIVDVNGCRSVNIDCHVFDNLGSSTISAFEFNNDSAHRLGDITLKDCSGYVTAAGGYALKSTCKTELINWHQLFNISAADVWINN